jgi:NAD(P)-dependent dehydrogenase (short-subunit alcohol dehydrogenase family)
MADNKVALITGAGSGIGRSVAQLFAERGTRVVVTDIDEDGGRKTVELIEQTGGTARFVRHDTSSAEDAQKVVNDTIETYGRLDFAVNNAGIGGPSAPVGEYPLEGWDKVIVVNLSGVFYGMRYQIPAMLKNNGGSIVNVASILGQVGFVNSSAYVAAKHGVVGLTKNAALEYSAKNIRINAVGPAFIRTPLIEKNLTEEQIAGLVNLHPIGRLGEPREVAEVIVWLCSDKASFVSGSYYAIDGGYLSQ